MSLLPPFRIRSRRITRSKTLIGLALTVGLLTTGLGMTFSPAANAATSCYAGGSITAGNGNVYTKRYCTTFATAPTYAGPSAANRIGTMYVGTNWVLCYIWNSSPNPVTYNSNGSANTNHVWLYTLGDTGGWGYMPATYVSQGGNEAPTPGVPSCGGSGPSTPPPSNGSIAAGQTVTVRPEGNRPGGPSGPLYTVAIPSGRNGIAVAAAMRQLGITYAWGGGGPNGPSLGIHDWGYADQFGDYKKIGFDCSGLTEYAWFQAGREIGDYSYAQYLNVAWASGAHQPGDLLFWGSPSRTHHVAMYVGNGLLIEAAGSGTYVHIRPVYTGGDFLGWKRP